MSEEKENKYGEAEALVIEYVSDPRPDLKDLIIVHYAPMVERIARRFSGVESAEDLAQVGYIGLMNALGKFNPEEGVRFNTYATHLVAGEIKHYLRDRSQTIRHPAWLQELRHKVNKAQTRLQAELGRTPNEREIADYVGVSESSVQEVFATQDMLKVASYHATSSDDDDSEDELDRFDPTQVQAEQVSVEDRVLLETAMQELRDLEREVLVKFHFDAMNQTEIAAELGISCNYVSHILRQSLNKMRRILSDQDQQERVLRREVPYDKEVMDDQLGIYNEDYFRSRLSEEIHRCVSQELVCSVVLLEAHGLDQLRKFYGDASVEDFLVDVATYLKNSVRALDLVCRNGESGFGVILPGTGINAKNILERIRTKTETWLSGRSSGNCPVTLSFGWACAPDESRSTSDVLKIAYNRMENPDQEMPKAS